MTRSDLVDELLTKFPQLSPRDAELTVKILLDAMSEALLALARHGDPNHRGIARWEPYSIARRQTLLFDVPATLADDPRGGERRFWQQAPFVQRGTM